MMYKSDQDTAEIIAKQVALHGGRAYYVGGYVRDRLMGIESKDIDIEIHGLTPDKTKSILDSVGDCIAAGASFGVFCLKGRNIDIALPRSETMTGRGGHKDFDIFVDPNIGLRKAAGRRDFTVNALMKDILSGELFDFYGGVEDIQKKVIRHVNSTAFPEDPLRVLRACRFASKLGFSIADETVELCSKMDLSALSPERIMGELENVLLSAEMPSEFFEELKKMNGLHVWFREIEALADIKQDPVFHPEGDVWKHTMKTIDEAAKLRGKAEKPFYFMLAALCHDLGKSIATKEIDGAIHAYGHDELGIDLAERLIDRLTRDTRLKKYVLNMVKLHMRPNMLVQQNASDKAYMKLFDICEFPDDLILLSKADYYGSSASGYEKVECELKSKLTEYRRRMSQPYVKGDDLVAAGMSPGPELGEALAYAHKLRLAGVDKREALLQTIGYLKHMRNCS